MDVDTYTMYIFVELDRAMYRVDLQAQRCPAETEWYGELQILNSETLCWPVASMLFTDLDPRGPVRFSGWQKKWARVRPSHGMCSTRRDIHSDFHMFAAWCDCFGYLLIHDEDTHHHDTLGRDPAGWRNAAFSRPANPVNVSHNYDLAGGT